MHDEEDVRRRIAHALAQRFDERNDLDFDTPGLEQCARML